MPAQPIPVERLVRHACDDGADLDDTLMGYTGGRLDGDVLTLTFTRLEDCDAGPDDDYASATYRFRLIPEDPS